MNDNMKIVKSPKESGLLIKVVSETIQREAEKQKGGFLSMLLGTLAATFFTETTYLFVLRHQISSCKSKIILTGFRQGEGWGGGGGGGGGTPPPPPPPPSTPQNEPLKSPSRLGLKALFEMLILQLCN